MKKIAIAIAAAATLMLASCTSVAPLCATGNELGSKVGQSTGTFLFGYLPLGGCDYSIQSAAKNGGIKKISTVDEKIYTGFFTTKVTTVVTGE